MRTGVSALQGGADPATQNVYMAAMFRLRGLFIAGLIATATLMASALPVRAAELLMFTRKHCPYCVLWERQVGPIYPKTDEAKIAPLRRIDLDDPTAQPPSLTPVVTFTPTFVLMQDGREVGRFSGYGDDLTFWSVLGTLLGKLATHPKPASITPSEIFQ